MLRLKTIITTLLFGLICLSCTKEKPYVVLISFDGFRHDYVQMYDTPNFDAFISKGSSSKGLIPSFPSKTFPNHYTIVTGLYPGNHGLVDNAFYDRDRKEVYRLNKRELVEDGYYYGGLPLWQLAQSQGLRSASYFWVGSEAEIAGSFPDYYEKYDGTVKNEVRIEQVGKWLRLPEKDRPQFVTLYFSLVDDQGHASGPNSEETGSVVKEADRLLGLLMQEVKKSQLPVNVILTSDHGMVQLRNDTSSFIRIDQVIDQDYGILEMTNLGTHAHFYFEKDEDTKTFADSMRSKAKGYRVHVKGEFPQHWHYDQHERIGDVIITAEINKQLLFRDWRKRNEHPYFGVHGFDPALTNDLNGIFYANGPLITPGQNIEPFQNIHIYPFIADLLNLKYDHKIDGDPSILAPLRSHQ